MSLKIDQLIINNLRISRLQGFKARTITVGRILSPLVPRGARGPEVQGGVLVAWRWESDWRWFPRLRAERSGQAG